MVKTLVLYESKYGFTKEIARDASMVLAPSYCSHVSQFSKDIGKFNVIAICTPVYNDLIPQSIMDFVKNNVSTLKGKKIILFCCCVDVDYGKTHLKPIRELLGNAVIWQEIIGTNIEINQLKNDDYSDLNNTSEKDEILFKDKNLFIKERFLKRLLKIKSVVAIDDQTQIVKEEGMRYAEDFLKSHNTCALATGHNNGIRVTPIEYIYRNGSIYLLSEGGQKFYFILQNPNVALCIYDNYTGFDELGGMQVQGTAIFIESGTEEYNKILTEKGIPDGTLDKYDITLYMIKINVDIIEFDWSGFKKLGFNTKQIFK